MLYGCCGAAFKGRQCRFPICGGPRLSVLENGFHFPDGPAFVSRYHTHPSAGADQRVRTDLVVDGHDRELGFRCPVEGEVEVAREDLPSRAVIQFDDVADPSRNSFKPRLTGSFSGKNIALSVPGEFRAAGRRPDPARDTYRRELSQSSSLPSSGSAPPRHNSRSSRSPRRRQRSSRGFSVSCCPSSRGDPPLRRCSPA